MDRHWFFSVITGQLPRIDNDSACLIPVKFLAKYCCTTCVWAVRCFHASKKIKNFEIFACKSCHDAADQTRA